MRSERAQASDRGGKFAARTLALWAALLGLGCTGHLGARPADGFDGGMLEYRAGIDLSGKPGVGGLSALHVSDDASRMTAITDDGQVLSGPLDHHPGGALAGWTVDSEGPLPGLPGRGKAVNDAEALARRADGAWLVAFERQHRILRYPAGTDMPAGDPTLVPIPASARSLPANKGIEALALRPDGILVALAEADVTGDGQHPLYLRVGGEWREKRYRTDPFYAPSDATALPDGGLLVLERGYSLIGGIRTRLAYVRSDDLLQGDVIEGTLLGEIEPSIGVDNFEGLAVHQTPEGGLVAYMVSDDNFSSLQRTLLVQYVLHLPTATAAPKRP